ncbi:hypothetical protein [Sunxiuqinia dokdonensis]|uniref:Uncharacterized protein n=1 Tax=Sunxiuqinia dokdonensis TaxID=1409788 RepID=A0A0L8V5R8_9BACT|nr:hypothetical protein [Sunxiuqinia dokdonensis]KOH43776.1 hypothetical protein NC99_33980 [Sunxiuqinia dokdonensis]
MFLSSAGHVADMIARMKANRELRKRNNPFQKNEPGIYEGKTIPLKYKPVSDFRKKSFLEKIKRESVRQRTNDRLFLLIFIGLFILLFGWFVRNYT